MPRRTAVLFGVTLVAAMAATSAVTRAVVDHGRVARAAASTPSPRSSPTAKPAPGPTVAGDQKLAVNAMKAFNRELGRVVNTGHATHARELSTSDCGCRDDIDSILKLRKSGPIRSTQFLTARLNESPRTSHDGMEVSIPARVTLATYSRLNKAGKAVQVEPRHPNIPVVYIVRLDGSKWKVSNIDGPAFYNYR